MYHQIDRSASKILFLDSPWAFELLRERLGYRALGPSRYSLSSVPGNPARVWQVSCFPSFKDECVGATSVSVRVKRAMAYQIKPQIRQHERKIARNEPYIYKERCSGK